MILETLLKDADDANVLEKNEMFYAGDIQAKMVFKDVKINLLEESRKEIKEANDRYRKLSIKQQQVHKLNNQKKKQLKLQKGIKEQETRVNKLLNSPYLKESEKIKKQFTFDIKVKEMIPRSSKSFDDIETKQKILNEVDDKIHDSINRPPEKFYESFKKYLQPVKMKSNNKSKVKKSQDNIGIAESFETNNNNINIDKKDERISTELSKPFIGNVELHLQEKEIRKDRKTEILEEWDKLSGIDVVEQLIEILMRSHQEKEPEDNLFNDKNLQIKLRPTSASANHGIIGKSRDLTPLLFTDNIRPATEGRERDRIRRGLKIPTRRRKKVADIPTNKIDNMNLENWPFI